MLPKNYSIFVQWMNKATDPLLRPFIGTFSPYELDSGFVIQFHEIMALIVYAFVGYLMVQGIIILGSHSSMWRRNKLKEYN